MSAQLSPPETGKSGTAATVRPCQGIAGTVSVSVGCGETPARLPTAVISTVPAAASSSIRLPPWTDTGCEQATAAAHSRNEARMPSAYYDAAMPATNWQEKVDPGETARFERYAEQLREIQRRNARGGAPARALHAKGQLGLEARLTVLPDLPAHARVGPFAAPATFRAYVRYSNGSGKRQHDARADVRGVAVKLAGVEGRKLIPGLENAKRRTS